LVSPTIYVEASVEMEAERACAGRVEVKKEETKANKHKAPPFNVFNFSVLIILPYLLQPSA
jgi:hypothetical protein